MKPTIIHYVKQYEPSITLLCGVDNGYHNAKGQKVSCKRCLRSMRAQGLPEYIHMTLDHQDNPQMLLFARKDRFQGFKRLFVMGVAWIKSAAISSLSCGYYNPPGDKP